MHFIIHNCLQKPTTYVIFSKTKMPGNETVNHVILYQNNRSSHRRCSVRKGVLRNFAKFTGKHLRQSLFFDKVAGLRSRYQISRAKLFPMKVFKLFCWFKHCVKSVHIRSFFGPYFSAFGLNTERYWVNSEYGHFSCSDTCES